MLQPNERVRAGRATAANARLEQAVAGLASVRARVAALKEGWARAPRSPAAVADEANRPPRQVGLCELPSDVMGKLLQRMGAAELSRMRAVCAKTRAAVDLWEPELWRSLVVREFIPEAYMSRLLRSPTPPGAGGRQLWSSWKRVYIGLHLKARTLPGLERRAHLLDPRHQDSQTRRRSARMCSADEVEQKRLANLAELSNLQRRVAEFEQRLSSLRQARKAAQAELSLYTSDGRWDPAAIQIHEEAMKARQAEEERRGAEKLRQKETLARLQASASQGVQALLHKVASVRIEPEEVAAALTNSPSFRTRSLDAPTDAIGMIELQLLGVLAALESAEDGGRPHSPESVGSDNSSETSPTGNRRQLQESPAPELPSVEINPHVADCPIFGVMTPLQWAVELGAPASAALLLRSGAASDVEDAWQRGRRLIDRVESGEGLLFASGRSAHAKLLRQLRGEAGTPSAAAAGSDPDSRPQRPMVLPPAVSGGWTGADASEAAGDPGVSQMGRQARWRLIVDLSSDSESEEDQQAGSPGFVTVATASLPRTFSSSSEEDDDGEEEVRPTAAGWSPNRKGGAGQRGARPPASPSVGAAAADVQTLIRDWVGTRGYDGKAVSFHWCGSRRLGVASPDSNADLCVVIPLPKTDPLLLHALMAEEASYPGSDTLAAALRKGGVSSVVSVPAAKVSTQRRFFASDPR